MTAEEQKLKVKVNHLIDKIEEMTRTIQERTTYIKLLEEEIDMLRMRKNASGAQVVKETETEIVAFLRDFSVISRMILENEDYIKYSYATKYSEDFYKIDKRILDEYVCQYATMDLKSFMDYCIDLALVKSEKDRKYTYTSGSVKVCYVSRRFMEITVKNPREEQQGA